MLLEEFQAIRLLFAEIENLPMPLSFAELSLSAQIYYFRNINLGAVNDSANLRSVEIIAGIRGLVIFRTMQI